MGELANDLSLQISASCWKKVLCLVRLHLSTRMQCICYAEGQWEALNLREQEEFSKVCNRKHWVCHHCKLEKFVDGCHTQIRMQKEGHEFPFFSWGKRVVGELHATISIFVWVKIIHEEEHLFMCCCSSRIFFNDIRLCLIVTLILRRPIPIHGMILQWGIWCFIGKWEFGLRWFRRLILSGLLTNYQKITIIEMDHIQPMQYEMIGR